MKLNIRSKLLIGFTLLLTLSSLVQGLSFLITKQYISSQISSFQKVQAEKGASEIQAFFSRLSVNSFGLARAYKKDEKELPLVANYVIKNNEYIKKISILSPSGRELAKFDKLGEIPKDNLSYEVLSTPFNSALAGSTAVSKVYYLEKSLGPHLDLFSPIFGDKNDVIGIVKMQINLDQLRIDMAHIKLGENGYIYITDNEGRLLEHPSAQFVLDRANLSSRKIVSNTINNTQSTSQDEEYTNEKNIPVVAKATKIPGYDWIAIFEQPTSEAFGFLTFIRNLFIVTLVGSFIFLLLIALFLSENLTRPIRKLQQSAQQMRMENEHLERMIIIKSGDEIESLSYSFASLIDRLLQKEESLKKTGIELVAANGKLKQLDKLKDEFVSLASHELRTPMTAIKSYLWMALAGKGGALNDKQKYYLERSYTATNRLIKLVNDMLNVSRIESGRISLDIKPIDITKIITDVIAEVTPRAQEFGLVVTFTPPSPPLPAVVADIDKIKEILINLIGNSLKFTPPGGQVGVFATHKDNIVVVEVRDSGKGIKAEDLPKLFQKFATIGTAYLTKQNTQGTGLGLYISKSLVEKQGGRMWLHSDGENKGTSFYFSLPIATQSAAL